MYWELEAVFKTIDFSCNPVALARQFLLFSKLFLTFLDLIDGLCEIIIVVL